MINQRGQTLLEILLAFGVSVMVLSAVIFGITTSLSNTQYSKNQNLANSYAQEGMAIIRQIRDSNWYNFTHSYETNATYCLKPGSIIPDKPEDLSKPCRKPDEIVGDLFSREIKFEHNYPDCSGPTPTPAPPTFCVPGPCPTIIPSATGGSKVTITVSWADNKCPVGPNLSNPFCHSVELITCFSSVDKKIGP